MTKFVGLGYAENIMSNGQERLRVQVPEESQPQRELSAAEFIDEILPEETEGAKVSERLWSDLRKKVGERAGFLAQVLGVEDGETDLDRRLAEEREEWENQVVRAMLAINRLTPAELDEVVRAWEAQVAAWEEAVEEGDEEKMEELRMDATGAMGLVVVIAQERGRKGRAEKVLSRAEERREQLRRKAAELEVERGARTFDERLDESVEQSTLSVLEGNADELLEDVAALRGTARPRLDQRVIDRFLGSSVQERVYGQTVEDRRQRLESDNELREAYLDAVRADAEFCSELLLSNAERHIRHFQEAISEQRSRDNPDQVQIQALNSHLVAWRNRRDEIQAQLESGDSFADFDITFDEEVAIVGAVSPEALRMVETYEGMKDKVRVLDARLSGSDEQIQAVVYETTNSSWENYAARATRDDFSRGEFSNEVETWQALVAQQLQRERELREGRRREAGGDEVGEEARAGGLEEKYQELRDELTGEDFDWEDLSSEELEMMRNGEWDDFEQDHTAVPDELRDRLERVCAVDGLVELKRSEEREALLRELQRQLEYEESKSLTENDNGFEDETLDLVYQAVESVDSDNGYLARRESFYEQKAERMEETNEEFLVELNQQRVVMDARVAQALVLAQKGRRGRKQAERLVGEAGEGLQAIVHVRVSEVEAAHEASREGAEELASVQGSVRAVDQLISRQRAEVDELEIEISTHESELAAVAAERGVDGAELMERLEGLYELDQLEEEAEVITLEERVMERLFRGESPTDQEVEVMRTLVEDLQEEVEDVDQDADDEVEELIDRIFDEVLVSQGIMALDKKDRKRRAAERYAKRRVKAEASLWELLAQISEFLAGYESA